MKFGPCPPKIALALPVLGALIAPTSAFPVAKNRFRPDRIPIPLGTIERVSDPFFNYAEVPVELKEGTAVPEPALVSNQQPDDDDIIDHVYDHEVRPLHDVASPIKDHYNASENAQAEREPYEAEDIASIEKRGVLPSLTGEDEEFTQPAQPAPSILEEEQEETQAELDNSVFEVKPNYYIQKDGKMQPRFPKDIRGFLDHAREDWQQEQNKGQNGRLEEDWVNAPHRKHVAEPTPAAGPPEPIPDHFEGHVEVPITPDNTTTAEDAHDVGIDAHLQSRSEGTPAITGDTPSYEVPVELLPEALLHADEEEEEEEEEEGEGEEPEQYIERRATHRLTIQDIEADEQDPATAPELNATEASPKVAFSNNPSYSSDEGQARIDRPVIQR